MSFFLSFRLESRWRGDERDFAHLVISLAVWVGAEARRWRIWDERRDKRRGLEGGFSWIASRLLGIERREVLLHILHIGFLASPKEGVCIAISIHFSSLFFSSLPPSHIYIPFQKFETTIEHPAYTAPILSQQSITPASDPELTWRSRCVLIYRCWLGSESTGTGYGWLEVGEGWSRRRICLLLGKRGIDI